MHSPQYNSLEYLIMLECNRIPQIAVNCILIVRMPHPKPVPDWPGSWWGRSARCRWACPPAVICRVQNSDAGQPPFVEKGKRAIIGQGLSTAVHGVRRLRCHWRVQKLMLCVYIYIYIYIYVYICLYTYTLLYTIHTRTQAWRPISERLGQHRLGLPLVCVCGRWCPTSSELLLLAYKPRTLVADRRYLG